MDAALLLHESESLVKSVPYIVDVVGMSKK